MTARSASDGGDPLEIDGPAAPPRSNGEVVFTASWQPRLFAATVQLRDQDLIPWERFRQGLINEIAAHEQELDGPDAYDYWGCWQRALERLLAELGIVDGTDLDRAGEVIAARPAAHD
ncbi:MAG: nitrile hydratase accessory protein [Acidimicrobiia bacterium]|nr:nitrile hydratase accessory protein [Acidimicrobiia bacterium]